MFVLSRCEVLACRNRRATPASQCRQAVRCRGADRWAHRIAERCSREPWPGAGVSCRLARCRCYGDPRVGEGAIAPLSGSLPILHHAQRYWSHAPPASTPSLTGREYGALRQLFPLRPRRLRTGDPARSSQLAGMNHHSGGITLVCQKADPGDRSASQGPAIYCCEPATPARPATRRERAVGALWPPLSPTTGRDRPADPTRRVRRRRRRRPGTRFGDGGLVVRFPRPRRLTYWPGGAAPFWEGCEWRGAPLARGCTYTPVARMWAPRRNELPPLSDGGGVSPSATLIDAGALHSWCLFHAWRDHHDG